MSVRGAPWSRSRKTVASIPPQLEATIQRSIVDALNRLGFSALVNSVSDKRRGAQSGLGVGSPDVLVMDRDRAMFIEVKRPGEGRRPSQVEWHAWAVTRGIHVVTVDNVADGVRAAVEWRQRRAA